MDYANTGTMADDYLALVNGLAAHIDRLGINRGVSGATRPGMHANVNAANHANHNVNGNVNDNVNS